MTLIQPLEYAKCNLWIRVLILVQCETRAQEGQGHLCCYLVLKFLLRKMLLDLEYPHFHDGMAKSSRQEWHSP